MLATTIPNPRQGAARRRTQEPIADRNRRWLDKVDRQGLTPAEIAHREGFSKRAVLLGIQWARANPAAPPADPCGGIHDESRLSAQQLGGLERMVRGSAQYQTPEVLEWLASLRGDRRRAGYAPGSRDDD